MLVGGGGSFSAGCLGKEMYSNRRVLNKFPQIEAFSAFSSVYNDTCLFGIQATTWLLLDKHYPVTSSFGVPAFFSLERAAAPYFGIKAYGVHMNGYVEINGQKFLWIGKRSQMKPTYPGMLDHLVAGGLPHGISCKENLIKECEEEAGIPRSISDGAISVGAISYMDIDAFRYKRDVLFCYDLRLPADFIPNNEDGEVDSFRLIPVDNVANIIRRTELLLS